MDKPKKGTLLRDAFPEIYAMIDRNKNDGVNISMLTYSSDKELFWFCSKSECCHPHSWKAPIIRIVRSKNICVFCSGKRICECKSVLYCPEVMRYWDYKRNEEAGIYPGKISKNSRKDVFCICDKHKTCDDHKWKNSAHDLMRNGCAYCRHTFVCKCDSLAIKRSDIMIYWDLEENKKLNLDPYKISVGSAILACWKCPNHKTCNMHNWKIRISAMTDKNRVGCSYCEGNKNICRCRSFPVLFPYLLKEFDKNKNQNIDPYCIGAGSAIELWWLCDKNHSWKRSVYGRSEGHGCSICRQSKLEKECREALDELMIRYGITHEPQGFFTDCKDLNILRFDRKIFKFKKDTLAELDGGQHFKDVYFNGKTSNLEDNKRKDMIKNKYCKDNNKHLIRISYSEKTKIKEHLIKFFEQILMSEQDNNQTVILFIGKEYYQ